MAEVTASIFQEKLDNFLTSVEIVAEQKIPAWFRPFMDTVKEFAMNVNDFFDQFHRSQVELESKLGVQRSVTDALDIDRKRIADELVDVQMDLGDLKQYTRRNHIIVHAFCR